MKTEPSFLNAIRATLSVLVLAVCLTSTWAQKPPACKNPVVAGDFPDPSVIRVGQDYWATATSGEWAPEFQILHSRDLVNWEIVGAVFQKRPSWTVRNFWAPEISEYKGRYFVYYTARKKGGPLCVAAASASSPNGPYMDHGPLVCQDIGSIDPVPATDERGERYLIWKEDGNSREQPTIIWAQKLNEDGTKVVGSKKELIRNDPKSWEGGVVEGAFVLRRGDWFYLFYSGNTCCGRRCDYALGVARARSLLGPWEKNPSNPILAENQAWQCPGHGSIVTDEGGHDFLLYHAYRKSQEAFYIGRETMLDEVTWGTNGWPSINNGKGPGERAPVTLNAVECRSDHSFFDDFSSSQLQPSWQWPQENEPVIHIETERGGRLVLTSAGGQSVDPISALLSQPSTSANYIATVAIDLSSLKRGVAAGLSAYNDRDNALGVMTVDGKILLYTRENKSHKVVKSLNAPAASVLYLRMTVKDGSRYRFAYSVDGRDWKEIDAEIDGGFLEAVRLSLTVGGVKDASAKFESVRITPS